MPVTQDFPTIAYGMGDYRHVTLGTFYRGGSFPRTWTLHQYGEMLVLEGRNLAGSFHSRTIDVAGELRYADSLGPDTELSEHHAFASAIRVALSSLELPDPTA